MVFSVNVINSNLKFPQNSEVNYFVNFSTPLSFNNGAVANCLPTSDGKENLKYFEQSIEVYMCLKKKIKNLRERNKKF